MDFMGLLIFDNVSVIMYIIVMTTTLSIRELTRSGKTLLDYDYIEIEDKKAHQYKGIFVPNRYAEEVKELINSKIRDYKKKTKNCTI
jgi:hypothetical protein